VDAPPCLKSPQKGVPTVQIESVFILLSVVLFSMMIVAKSDFILLLFLLLSNIGNIFQNDNIESYDYERDRWSCILAQARINGQQKNTTTNTNTKRSSNKHKHVCACGTATIHYSVASTSFELSLIYIAQRFNQGQGLQHLFPCSPAFHFHHH
jgi:hypothetical protein